MVFYNLHNMKNQARLDLCFAILDFEPQIMLSVCLYQDKCSPAMLSCFCLKVVL